MDSKEPCCIDNKGHKENKPQAVSRFDLRRYNRAEPHGKGGIHVMEDDKHLCRAPGIGKKTAGRIILELKDKIKTEEVTQGVDIQEGFEDIIPNNANSVEEALGALLALGYSEKEAENTLKKVNKHESVENIIKECLRVLMG